MKLISIHHQFEILISNLGIKIPFCLYTVSIPNKIIVFT